MTDLPSESFVNREPYHEKRAYVTVNIRDLAFLTND